MKYLVFPATKDGSIIKGFCPTVCYSKANAEKEATIMALNYGINGVKFHHIHIIKQ